MIKKVIAVIIAAVLCAVLAACSGRRPVREPENEAADSIDSAVGATDSSGAAGGAVKNNDAAGEAVKGGGAEPASRTAVLYADFSSGSMDNEDLIIAEEWEFDGTGDITPELLAEGLTEWTGLDFYAAFTQYGNIIEVDWDADSTLVAGLDDREQKEEFFFFDAESLRWFMMDSMLRTLTEELGAEEVYYTMDGGQELWFEELYPVNDFPSDIPYAGSPFYFSHVDLAGTIESDEDAMSYLSSYIELQEGQAFLSEGEDEINGEHCWLVAFGGSTPEKFTAEVHFAVADSGNIYMMDILTGDYVPFDGTMG